MYNLLHFQHNSLEWPFFFKPRMSLRGHVAHLRAPSRWHTPRGFGCRSDDTVCRVCRVRRCNLEQRVFPVGQCPCSPSALRHPHSWPLLVCLLSSWFCLFQNLSIFYIKSPGSQNCKEGRLGSQEAEGPRLPQSQTSVSFGCT